MSWFQENKFLAVFGGAVLVVGGALGYMTFAASSKYDDAQTRFNEAQSNLNNLYKASPYPMDDNVKEYAVRQKQVKAEIEKLQGELAAVKVKTEKPEDVAPNFFQDRLKDAVAKWVGKAQEMDATISAKDFYLGFNTYKDKPPGNNVTAAALLKELRAIELVMDLLLRAKGVEIKDFSREELKEEQKAPEPDKKNAKAGPQEPKVKLIRKTSFAVKFITTQAHFMAVMNGLAGHKEQVFVVRNLTVKNTAQDSPPKVAQNAFGQPGNAVAGAAAAAPAGAAAPLAPAPADAGPQTVFGEERLEVTLDIDIADVADPETPVAPKGNNKSK